MSGRVLTIAAITVIAIRIYYHMRPRLRNKRWATVIYLVSEFVALVVLLFTVLYFLPR